MDDYPLLLFPSPEVADRTKRQMVPGKVHMPSAKQQGERLSAAFQQLQNSFNTRKVGLQQTPLGIDPEQVLVIETVGNIENFANAVKEIPGLEWMGEIETEEIIPDSDFYYEEDPEKVLNGRFYLILTNQKALTQMLSLWNKYQSDTSMTFKRGLTKFRDVFLHLKNIRKWDVKDRLDEEKVFEVWQNDLRLTGQRNVRFEVILWYRENAEKRSESECKVVNLIQEAGGKVITKCVISSIAHHSILGEISSEFAQSMIEQPEVDLVKCEHIMFFCPTPQIATGCEEIEGEVSDCTVAEQELPPPSGKPIVAVLDGLPLENHQLLAKRLMIDDPDDFASNYSAIDRQHGTAITSLIVHGDLNRSSYPLDRLVYVRPILKPVKWLRPPNPEQVPEDVIFVDYIHKAVKRIMEGEGEHQAVAPSVKIINFSIGDSSQHFSQSMSPLARLLDWLSIKYNILFIISSGNHTASIDTGMKIQNFEALSNFDREALVVKKIYENIRHRRLLSPGESINGVTVGALHHDDSSSTIKHFVDVFKSVLPSPISAFGTGYRRSIKPDLLFSGGRVLYSSLFTSSSLKFQRVRVAPGNKVAAPSLNIGELNKTQFCCGSSNSAALTSRTASIYYDHLARIFKQQASNVNFSVFDTSILKAMLIHGCSWNKLGTSLREILKSEVNGEQVKNWISRWIGYGIPDIEKVLRCNEQRATLLGCGTLDDGKAHVYNLPLPPSLNAQRGLRRLTVTLAWLSPVASTTQRYRVAQLWFDFENGKKSREKLNNKLRVLGIDSDSNATRRGTIQHEIFEGESATAISDGDTLRIKVNCRKDASKIKKPVAYGLVVSLEVGEEVNLPIYNEVRARIATKVGVPTRG